MAKRIFIMLSLVVFFMAGESRAMNEQNTGTFETKEMNSAEKEQLQKRMLLKEHMKTMGAQQKDVHSHIGRMLHELSQDPVLDATLVLTHSQTKENVSFKIRNLVKDGILDISNKVFGDAAQHMVITTDPSVFFANHGDKLVILIAPWSLIQETLSSSSAPLKPIMEHWDQTKAPIGIFWRNGKWPEDHYDYLTRLSSSEIPSFNMYELWGWESLRSIALHKKEGDVAMWWGEPTGYYRAQEILNNIELKIIPPR